jgi:hypothetical protein
MSQMTPATPSIQELARKLIALQAAHETADKRGAEAIRACERLRVPLSRLAGAGGFRSLISRAMALAKAEVPGLELVHIQADGSFAESEVEKLAGGSISADMAGFAILTQLLGLLMTFIGEPLTLALVREAWPQVFVDETDRGAEERS